MRILNVYSQYDRNIFNLTDHDEILGQNEPIGSHSTHESDGEECRLETDGEETKHKHVTFNILTPVLISNSNSKEDLTQQTDLIKDYSSTSNFDNKIDDFYDNAEGMVIHL